MQEIGDNLPAQEKHSLSGPAHSTVHPQAGRKGGKGLLKSQAANLFDQLPINSSCQRPGHPSQVAEQTAVEVDSRGSVGLRLLGDTATCLARRQAPKSSSDLLPPSKSE